jgi:hypothetical protein
VNGPKRPTLTLEGKGKPATAKSPQKPQAPNTPPPSRKPRGPSYTPPRQPVARMDAFWLVMRESGRRPKVRHATLDEARTEAQRIASNCRGASVWVIECRTIETVQVPTTEATRQAPSPSIQASATP